MAEANWSELPNDILILIWKLLDNELDLIRFRSICPSWRSSVSNHNPHNFIFKLPPLNFSYTVGRSYNKIIMDSNTPLCHFSQLSHFLIKPQQQQQLPTLTRPWLIRITQNSLGKTQLFHPLIPNVRPPRLLDFNQLPIIHLGTGFIIDDDNYQELFNPSTRTLHPLKVLSLGPTTVFALLRNQTTHAVLFRFHHDHWEVFSDVSTSIRDICLFKNCLYAVDRYGRTFTVQPDSSSVQLVAEPLLNPGGYYKLLVESEGELLLVVIYDDVNFFCVAMFKLDEKEKKWMDISSLGDRVLLFATGCSFSASALDLGLPRGNCIVFMVDAILSSENMQQSGICIFNYQHLQLGNSVYLIDQPQLLPLSDFYPDLFSPPPDWIVNTT